MRGENGGRASKKLSIRDEKKDQARLPAFPTLFNISIEPLLQRLNRAAGEDGYHIAGEGIAAMAYADDILLLAGTERGMQNLLQITQEFIGSRY